MKDLDDDGRERGADMVEAVVEAVNEIERRYLGSRRPRISRSLKRTIDRMNELAERS